MVPWWADQKNVVGNVKLWKSHTVAFEEIQGIDKQVASIVDPKAAYKT